MKALSPCCPLRGDGPTPLPWRVGSTGFMGTGVLPPVGYRANETDPLIACWSGGGIGTDEAAANAEFVARACNSHDDLLSNLQFAVKLLNALPGFRGTAQAERMEAAIARASHLSPETDNG